MLSFFQEHKIIAGIIMVLLVVTGYLFSLRIGPYHSYELDFVIPTEQTVMPGRLEVGIGVRDITPDMSQYDSWEDANGNGKWDRKTDRIIKRTKSRQFQPVWLAGFQVWRPAKDVHNPQWIRALALRNNGVTVVLVTIDSIGIYHNDYITIRKMINPALAIDHIVFSATHSHSLIDTMKLWSGRIPILGYDSRYIKILQEKAKEAIEEAYYSLQPADMYCVTLEVPEEHFINDSRLPIVYDRHMYLWRFTKPNSETTLATVVNWGNHPEVMDGSNHFVSSDYPHWLRLGMEQGVAGSYGAEGFGGTCLFFQGMIGGLMNPLRIDVPHRDNSIVYKERTFEKTEALGTNLAVIALNALRSDKVWKNTDPMVAVAAKTIKAPVQGMFKYGIMLGLFHKGYFWGGYAKTEVNVLRIGDVVILTTPGELYPEIVLGSIEAKPGRDYDILPVEVPPLMQEMTRYARQGLVFGLANDEIGYIIPKSQWDTEPPFIYNNEAQYGEENSGGPEVAGTFHRCAMALLTEINKTFAAVPPQSIDAGIAQATGLAFLPPPK